MLKTDYLIFHYKKKPIRIPLQPFLANNKRKQSFHYVSTLDKKGVAFIVIKNDAFGEFC